MNPEQIFSLTSLIAIAGWILLIALPRRPWASTIAGRAIPLLLSAVYLMLLFQHWGEGKGGFGSLATVSELFANPYILLAGWIHYLAFDLFVGAWQVRDAAEHRISHWLVVPCLVLTFLFGPVGLFSYFAARSALEKVEKLRG